jgi:hypothetical protein
VLVGGQVERLGVQAQQPGRPGEVLQDVAQRLQPSASRASFSAGRPLLNRRRKTRVRTRSLVRPTAELAGRNPNPGGGLPGSGTRLLPCISRAVGMLAASPATAAPARAQSTASICGRNRWISAMVSWA